MLRQFVLNENENKSITEKQIKLILKICDRKMKDIDEVLDDSKVNTLKIYKLLGL